MDLVKMVRLVGLAALFALGACSGGGREGEPQVVNVYSGRHYDSDREVFAAFTEKTGIEVRTLEAEGNQLLERLRAEGEYANADVVITVDAGNLWRLTEAGLLQPIQSGALNAATPAKFRDPQGRWFGFSKRARVIAYAKGRVQPDAIASMDALASPAMRGKVCARSSTNLYNLSLLAARIERDGKEAALEWARGVAGNFARPPQGSDTDQLRALVAGVCDVAIVNHYYLVRLQASPDEADRRLADQIGLVFPDKAGAGTHVNISGAGLAQHAQHRENGVKLIEYLASVEAQEKIAALNDEFPVNPQATLPAALGALGAFKEEVTGIAALGARQAEAQAVFDEAGWR